MRFSEQLPSKQWAALKYRGEKFAEVWFKPGGEPCGLTFRIPQKSFHLPGMDQQLTMENLLKTVGLAPGEVESWNCGNVSHAGMNGANPELKNALPAPPPHVAQVDIHVRLHPHLHPQPDAVAPPTPNLAPQRSEQDGKEIPLALWQDLEARWKAILTVEVTMDVLRKSLESVQGELEASFKKGLSPEEKTHAPRADISQWERAKQRVHFAVPKVKEAIHRTTWALGAPERKRMEELYKEHIQPHIPFPEMENVLLQLENLLKDRQILAANAQTAYQESKSIAAEVQGALRTLQNNAATNEQKKKAEGKGGKFFKSVRKMSGA